MRRRQLLTGAAALGAYAALQRGAHSFGLGRLGAGFGRLGALGGMAKVTSASLVLPGTPLAVYSSVQLSGYSGNWARVLNAGTSAVTDIPFANGIPSQSAITTARASSTLSGSILYDQSGNGFNATQTSSAFNPGVIAANIWNGIQPLTYDGAPSSTTRELALPSGLSTASQSVSIFRVVRPLPSYQGTSYGQLGASGSSILNFWQLNGTSNGPGGYDGTTEFTNPSFANMVRDQPTVIGITASATAVTYYIDNLSATSAAPASHAMTGGLIGAWSGGNAVNASLDDLALVIYGTALNSTAAQAVIAALQAAFPGTTRSASFNLIWDGDSIEFGAGLIGAGNLTNLPRQTEPLLNFPVNSWNVAVSGTTLATQEAKINGLLGTQIYDATKTVNVYVCNGGTNDITGSATLTALQTSATAYVTAVHAKGAKAKVILSTILPQNGFSGPEQTIQLAYNSWLVGGGSGADAVADIASNATMGPQSAASNTSLYVGGLHPTVLGYSFLAPILAAAINSLL